MPFWAVHMAVNWSWVRAPVTVDVTCGLGDTPPSHSVAGIGVSGSELATVAAADDPALDEAADDEALADEAAVDAAVVEEDVDPPHEDDATHRRPPSAAERSA